MEQAMSTTRSGVIRFRRPATSQVLGILKNPELAAVVVFSSIGLLLTSMCLTLSFSHDAVAVLAQLP
jgi:hypothetical protein